VVLIQLLARRTINLCHLLHTSLCRQSEFAYTQYNWWDSGSSRSTDAASSRGADVPDERPDCATACSTRSASHTCATGCCREGGPAHLSLVSVACGAGQAVQVICWLRWVRWDWRAWTSMDWTSVWVRRKWTAAMAADSARMQKTGSIRVAA
jgi:hypothetical protein